MSRRVRDVLAFHPLPQRLTIRAYNQWHISARPLQPQTCALLQPAALRVRSPARRHGDRQEAHQLPVRQRVREQQLSPSARCVQAAGEQHFHLRNRAVRGGARIDTHRRQLRRIAAAERRAQRARRRSRVRASLVRWRCRLGQLTPSSPLLPPHDVSARDLNLRSASPTFPRLCVSPPSPNLYTTHYPPQSSVRLLTRITYMPRTFVTGTRIYSLCQRLTLALMCTHACGLTYQTVSDKNYCRRSGCFDATLATIE